ncbi:hypothetical protein BHE74_00032418 [Ensete ventricosum]|nr:hypothetical protein BHE74_00032418 [Ensete ventricosum]
MLRICRSSPTPLATVAAQSLLEVEEVRAGAVAKKGVEAPNKRAIEEVLRPRKKVKVSNRHKSRHAWRRGFQVPLMTDLPPCNLEAPLEARWSTLKQGTRDIIVCPSWVDPPESGEIGAVFAAVSIGELIIGGVADCMSCGMCRTIACIIPSSAWTWWVRPRKALAVIAAHPCRSERGWEVRERSVGPAMESISVGPAWECALGSSFSGSAEGSYTKASLGWGEWPL